MLTLKPTQGKPHGKNLPSCYSITCANKLISRLVQSLSARDRYNAGIHRVIRVLDIHLKDRSWLVGDKCTYADLSFFT